MRSISARALTGAALAGVAALVAPGSASAAPACERAALAPAHEAALTALINRRRGNAGVAKVRRHHRLRAAGRRKSLAMARGARFAHSGGLPWAKGRAAGQNLAMAFSARQALRAMLRSPSHRSNLLAHEWRFGGVGAARNCEGVLYFTVNLMAPRPRR